MMLVTLIGSVLEVECRTTPGDREYIVFTLITQGFKDRKVFWKCRDFYSQHRKLISWMWPGRQILVQGHVTSNDCFMTKHGQPASMLSLRVGELMFLPNEQNPDKVPIADEHNVLASLDHVADQDFPE